jgi:hypothetical protein
MSLSKHFLRGIVFAVCAIFFVSVAHAQYRASIQGTVTDPQGAAVSGATVTLTNHETNQTLTITTNDSGIYNFNGLPPSQYTLTVEKTGFKKKVLDNVGVIAEQANALNVQLDVGDVATSVTVSGDSTPLIDTETSNVSGTVDSQQIQKLPSFGRDVFQLLQLAPGVFGDGSRNQGGDTQIVPGNAGPGGSGGTAGVFATENRPQISANGGRTDANNVTLDGIGITSVSWGGAAIVTPNEDSVKEVKVVANSYDAENGRFGGAQTQVITQNGTNQYHGSIFFKADRPGLNSFQAWSGTAGAPTLPQKDTSRFNQWGGSAGGPILKNKLFAFFAYETIRNHSVVTSTGWYDTAAWLKLAPSGSLAARYAAYPGESPAGTAVIDQTCGSVGLIDAATAATLIADGVPGAQANCVEIPGQGLNIGRPLTSALGTSDPSQLSPIKDPVTGKTYYRPGLGGNGSGNSSNLDPTTPTIAFIQTGGPNNTTNQQYNGRLDFNATSKDLVAFNIYKVPVDSTNFNGARPANLFHHDATNEAETLLWSHTFSATVLNEARANAAGWRWNELQSNPQIPLGLPQTQFIGDPTNGDRIGTANPGSNALGGPAGSVFDQWTYGYKDTVSKVHASHLMKFGGELTELHFVQEAPWSARPNWGFNNYWDFLNDAPSFETGVFNPQTGVPTDVRKDSRSTLYALFAQDDYKLRPNLTLNLGLRWEYFGPITFTRNQLATVVLGSGANALTGMSMRIGGNLYNADKHDFGPQLGFAWSPRSVGGHDFGSRLVIRGGFGIGYTDEEQAITLNGWPNIPFTNNGIGLSGSNIVYNFPSNPHQFGNYPANPNTILTFNSNNIPTSGSPVGVTAFPANYPTTYNYRYSLEAQYDLGGSWVATLGYQGSLTRHLTRQYNLNEIYGAQGIALNPMISDVDYYAQDGNAKFNALLTELQHRFARSFELDVQYRFSKSMDNESSPYSISNYQWNPAADWGPSDYDVTHAFKVWGIYSPTLFHGSRSWVEKVAGGWSFSGILNAHSGFPWTPSQFGGTCAVIYAPNDVCGPNGSNGGFLPAAYLGGAGNSYSNSTFLGPGGNFPKGGLAYFTLTKVTPCTKTFPATCSAPPAPGPGLRNAFRGPRYFDVDATLSKAFGLPHMPVLGEGARLEFRINAYNLFNSLNLTNMDATISDPHFGQATGALGGRTVEMQARFSF